MSKTEKYLLAAAALVVAVLIGRSWLAEHDARLNAEATVKTAQTAIDGLQQKQTAVTQAAQSKVVVLQAQAAAVKTPEAAVAALPSVEAPDQPLEAEAIPDSPQKIAVDAVPLYQTLNTCQQTSTLYGACTESLAIQKDIDTQKDVQIKALQQKPSFWKRVETTAITLGIGAAAGYALHR